MKEEEQEFPDYLSQGSEDLRSVNLRSLFTPSLVSHSILSGTDKLQALKMCPSLDKGGDS